MTGRRLPLEWIWLAIWYGSSALWLASGEDPGFSLPDALAPGRDAYGRPLLPLIQLASLRSSGFALAAVLLAFGVSLAGSCLLALLPHRTRWPGESVLQFLVAFPSVLFALAVGAWTGPGRGTVFAALLLGMIPGLARHLLVRVREISSREFIEAAMALGASRLRIVYRHLLPHLIPWASVKMPALLVQALLAEASLSFIGIGFPAGIESWGTLLAQARDYLIEAPLISLCVGLPLVLTVASIDVISKQLEPELR
jgi:peptide/nickel transport system permease protein